MCFLRSLDTIACLSLQENVAFSLYVYDKQFQNSSHWLVSAKFWYFEILAFGIYIFSSLQSMVVQYSKAKCYAKHFYCVITQKRLLPLWLLLCINGLEVQVCAAGPRHMELCFLVKSRWIAMLNVLPSEWELIMNALKSPAVTFFKFTTFIKSCSVGFFFFLILNGHFHKYDFWTGTDFKLKWLWQLLFPGHHVENPVCMYVWS